MIKPAHLKSAGTKGADPFIHCSITSNDSLPSITLVINVTKVFARNLGALRMVLKSLSVFNDFS